ncbi:MAG: HlyC/CorC family transporter [Anaerolineales bacterium]|nr:HlyC/CorC family transporter [Anaerolineales bacterium]
MENELASDLIRIVIVFLLVLANGFFVTAEFALVSVRRTRIAELVAQGNNSARWVHKAIHNPDRFIAATQLGITLASLGLGWIGEPALGDLLLPIVRLFPAAIENEVSRSISSGLAFAVITFLHVVIGELAPKSIALQHPERAALIVAKPTVWTEWIFKPAIWALNGAGNLILKWIGIQPASGHELVHSVEELKMLVTASAEGGIVEDDAENMLYAIFDFGETLVRQVMIPRTEMIAVPRQIGIEKMLEIAVDQPFTKLPVYRESLDQILGIVHLKDILQAKYGRIKDVNNAGDIMREAIYIPETAHVSSLLNEFRRRKQHIAIVLDEYGGTAGVVTLADILEEIVGEVSDPFDREPEIQPLPDGSSLIDGLTLIEEVNEQLGLELVDPNYDTIAGFLLGKLERLAKVGDSVYEGDIILTVEAMDGLRIASVSLGQRPHKKAKPTDRPDDRA